MSEITNKLNQIRERIKAAELQYQRIPGSVKLVAVTKQQPIAVIQEAIDAGQTCFAENYVQEALSKIEHFIDDNIEWHFIGPVQSNKTKLIAEHFQCVQSIDRLKIAERLNHQRPFYLPPLQVCVQVNIDNDPVKSGIDVDEINTFVEAITQLPRLQLRGLMTILTQYSDAERIMASYKQLRKIFEDLQQQYSNIDTLSMGMSADFELAIACGSTCVRVGSAIFGERQ